MSEVKNNMALWGHFENTDPAYTKQTNNGGYEHTSIAGMYMFQLATEAFGPWGIGWGAEIIVDRYDDGGPLMVGGGNGQPRQMVNTPNGPMLEKHHVLHVRLWYVHDDKRGEVIGVGTTKALYGSGNGFVSDAEAPKKSYTDAVKNALSKIGVAHDIYLNKYSNPEYVAQAAAVNEAKKAEENGQTLDGLISDLKDLVTKTVETLATSKQLSEVNGLYSSVWRKLNAHKTIVTAKKETAAAERIAKLEEALGRATHAAKERINGKPEDSQPAEEKQPEAPEAAKKKTTRRTTKKAEDKSE